MNIKKEFTEPECEWFRCQCNFTEDELSVFNLRVRGKSIVEIAEALRMSDATVNRRIKDVKRKMLKVI